MTTPTDTLDRLRELDNAATPGPWSAANEHELLGRDAQPAWCVSQMCPGFESMSETEGYITDVAEVFEDEGGPDAALIAAYRNETPALVAALTDVLALADDLASRVVRKEEAAARLSGQDKACAEADAATYRWISEDLHDAITAHLGGTA